MRTTSANISVKFLTSGIDGVADLVEDHKNPGPLVAAAAKSLADQGVDVSDLESFAASFLSNGGKRGKPAPKVGDSRDYKAQRNKTTGNLFLNVPLPSDVVEVMAGDSLTVTFEDGKIVIC